VSELLAGTADLSARHPHAVWAVAFLVAASESIVVVGALVPGTPVLMAIGAAGSLGHVSLAGVVAGAVLGAVAGDGLSYWIGHRYGERLARGWPFAGRPERLARGRAFIDRFGLLAVGLARFLPAVRAIVPVVAGMLGMPPARFYLANVASALIWAPLHVLPGALVGFVARLHLSDEFDEWAIPTAALTGLVVWALHRRRRSRTLDG
jgi:undecaprenyl-diphosphatase